MKIGTALALVAVGLILVYAVDVDIPVLDVRTLGSILFFVGLLGLAITVWLEYASRRPQRPPRAPRAAREARGPEPPSRPERSRPFDPIVPPHEHPRELPRDRSDDRTRRL